MSCLRFVAINLAVLMLVPANGISVRAEQIFDSSALYGEWEVETLERKGRPQPRLTFDLRFVISETTMTLMQRSRPPITVTYEVNPNESPSYLTWTHHDRGGPLIQRGIFDLEYDTLKLCMGAIRCARPKKFATYYYDDATLFVLKRVRPKVDSRTSDAQQWLPLGVFTLSQEGETASRSMIQLVINEEGRLVGELFDFSTKQKHVIEGALNKQSQRVSWTVGKDEGVKMETDLSTLTDASGKVSVTQPDHPVETWILTFGFRQFSQPEGSPEPLPQSR